MLYTRTIFKCTSMHQRSQCKIISVNYNSFRKKKEKKNLHDLELDIDTKGMRHIKMINKPSSKFTFFFFLYERLLRE